MAVTWAWINLSQVAVGALALVYVTWVRALPRRRALGFRLPVAAALTVCTEACLVHALSAFHSVGRTGLLVAHGAWAAAVGTWALATPGGLRSPRWRRLLHPATLIVAALGAPLALSALEYGPTNWDSMTYHLARVAHWLQHGSVAPYSTSIDRQIIYPPGAEYLVLVLQGIAGSDRLDAFVQLAAWALIAGSAPAVARAFGVPRRLAPWVAVVAAASPMAVLQASSTQNDLVAAVMAMAVVVASLPFLHRRARWRGGDVAVLVASVAAAWLVKPTALLAALPVAVVAAWGALRSWNWRHAAAAWRGALVGAVIAAGAAGPFLAWRPVDPARKYEAYVYQGFERPWDRAVNVLRGVGRHVPLPAGIERALTPSGGTVGCDAPGRFCAEMSRRAHEDYAGNPWNLVMAVTAVALGLMRWHVLPVRARLAVASAPAAWIAFHWMMKDNVWLSRLQLPLFALAPLGFAAIAAVPRRWATRLVVACAVVAAASAASAALRNETRPPELDPAALARGASSDAYYTGNGADVREAHEVTLRVLREGRCRRLGLAMGDDNFDYALTWRAMALGVEVRHVVGPDSWPCLVYFEDGQLWPRADGGPWIRTEHSYLLAAPDP